MLTEAEKWSFDLHGYLVLKGAVPQADVKRMVELCDTWHSLDDSELPPPLRSYHDANTKPSTPRSINNVPYADEVFQRLVLNREIMRVVLALTGNSPQLRKNPMIFPFTAVFPVDSAIRLTIIRLPTGKCLRHFLMPVFHWWIYQPVQDLCAFPVAISPISPSQTM